MRMQGRIHLTNMAFYGYHGHQPGENEGGQRFFVDVVLALDIAEAAATDHLSATVDYDRVYAICRRIVENDRVKLLETLCRRIIEAILAECPRVETVEITIRKPSAPVAGVLDHVAVQTSGSRADRVFGAGQ